MFTLKRLIVEGFRGFREAEQCIRPVNHVPSAGRSGATPGRPSAHGERGERRAQGTGCAGQGCGRVSYLRAIGCPRARRWSPAIGEPVAQGLGCWLGIVGQTLEQVAQISESIDAVPVTTGGHAE